MSTDVNVNNRITSQNRPETASILPSTGHLRLQLSLSVGAVDPDRRLGVYMARCVVFPSPFSFVQPVSASSQSALSIRRGCRLGRGLPPVGLFVLKTLEALNLRCHALDPQIPGVDVHLTRRMTRHFMSFGHRSRCGLAYTRRVLWRRF